MKVDLGNYQYCETDELEEIGKIKNRTLSSEIKVNGTLFKTESGNYIFHGRIYNIRTSINVCRGWKLLSIVDVRSYLSLCDTINNENKWDLLGYEKV